MSQKTRNEPPIRGERADRLQLESGLQALQSSPEFEGPVESLEGHESNDHLALIYESQAELFASAVPFMRQGIERGERCMYIADDNSRGEVLSAMREGDVDVDSALESGALTIHTKQDTYLRNGSFDPDEMISFLSDSIDDSLEEYEGFRVAGEMTWIFDDEPNIQDLMEYEGKLNTLFPGTESIALCQYNRNQFPAEIIRDVIRTHPHLIYDNTVCHNFYYTPPEEFFGPEQPEREIDRMMETLLDRTKARGTLQEREQHLREQNGITADPDRPFEEKLQGLFELGRERFDLELGAMARVDPDADTFEVEYVSDEHEYFEPGLELALSETYCTAATDDGGVGHVSDPFDDGYGGITVHTEFGIKAYLGAYIEVDGGVNRTFFFISSKQRDSRFTEEERTFQQLMSQWVKYELEHQHHEQNERELYEIAADTDRSFEEKLQDLFELGRERFGLELGALARIDQKDDLFEVETTSGEHEHLYPGARVALSETYCQIIADTDEAVGITEPEERGFEDAVVHEEFGVKSYLGTRIETDIGPNRSFFFISSEPRDQAITEEERTFHHLMGQWLKYELNRKQREEYQRQLYEITANKDLALDAKVKELLALGQERLGVDIAALTRERERSFEIEKMQGSHPDIEEGTLTPPMTENYCRRVVSTGEPVSVADAGAAGWEGDDLYSKFNLSSYAGVPVTVNDDIYGTVFFSDLTPREKEITDAEQRFIKQIAQSVSYELERDKQKCQLEGLNTLTRNLIETETMADASEQVRESAQKLIGLPVTAVALYDQEQGELVPEAATDVATELLRLTSYLDVGDSAGWEAFINDEVHRVDDPLEDVSASIRPSVTELVVLPLGTHGVFVTGATASDGFSSNDFEFIETVRANIKSAFDRIDREQQLQERERSLADQNQALERLNRINTIIRNIDQALVGASSRSEIESVVCEQLVEAGPYELAWVGEHDTVLDEVVPREESGADQRYLDEVTVKADDSPEGRGPAGRALKTQEPQVVNNVLHDESFGPWRQAALNRGYHAGITLPLAYQGTVYGILNVYAGQPEVFDDLEQAVLTELSNNIAYAINAIESKKALISDKMTELEFTVEDESMEILDLVRETGCEFSLKNLMPQSDGKTRIFFTTRGAPASEIIELAPCILATDVELVSGSEEDDESACMFEATLNEDSFIETILEHGGKIGQFNVAGESANITVHIAADSATREFVEMFQRQYENSELIAQRTHERLQATPTDPRMELTDELTARQLEALQTAYYSGYFKRPRTRTGSEIADTMSISQPTFNAHIRTAERELCRLIFEDGSEDAVANGS